MSATDEFAYHEVLDRLSIINDNLAEFVIDHALMDTETELRDLIIGAAAILHSAYQKVGSLKFDKFPDVQPKLVLALPAYEQRGIVVASDELIDGERLVCVAIKDAPKP